MKKTGLGKGLDALFADNLMSSEENLDESIQYQLYQGNERLELKENKTKEMTFRGNIEEQQNYTLKVTYDASKNTIEDIMQDIQIKVHSEQVKI